MLAADRSPSGVLHQRGTVRASHSVALGWDSEAGSRRLKHKSVGRQEIGRAMISRRFLMATLLVLACAYPDHLSQTGVTTGPRIVIDKGRLTSLVESTSWGAYFYPPPHWTPSLEEVARCEAEFWRAARQTRTNEDRLSYTVQFAGVSGPSQPRWIKITGVCPAAGPADPSDPIGPVSGGGSCYLYGSCVPSTGAIRSFATGSRW